MDTPLVLYEVAEQVAHLTLNHPEKRNALSQAMLTALRDRLAQRGAIPPSASSSCTPMVRCSVRGTTCARWSASVGRLTRSCSRSVPR